MSATAGVAGIALGRAYRACGLESFGNLLIKLHTVGHHHKSPVTRQLAQHLLRKKHHGKTLAAALRLPKHPAAPMPHLAGLQHRGNGIVHAQKLVVLADDFHQPRLVLRKKRKVFHQIKQAGRLASAAQHHLQRHTARLVFALYPLPLCPAPPISRKRANAAIGAIAGNQQRIAPKQGGYLLLVVAQVFVKRRPRRHARLFKFDDHPRQAIHKTHQIGAAFIHRPRYAELANQQKIVVFGAFPIHHAQALCALFALCVIGHRYRNAIFQQRVQLAVGGCQRHGRAVARQRINGGLYRLGR